MSVVMGEGRGGDVGQKCDIIRGCECQATSLLFICHACGPMSQLPGLVPLHCTQQNSVGVLLWLELLVS